MEKGFSSRQREILVRRKEFSPQEYFVYFKGCILKRWSNRYAVLLKIVFS